MIGDQLRNRMILYGRPDCINTAKCLQTAAEKGIDVEAKVITNTDDAEFRASSPFGMGPALQDIKFHVAGTIAVMSYMDDKGFGPSLVPRNGVLRAVMYNWAELAMNVAQPAMANDEMGSLDPLLDALNRQVEQPPAKGDFICGLFSLADIHWACVLNMMEIKGHQDAIQSRPALGGWYSKVKSHPSTSKENIIPFTTVPTAEDVKNGTMRDISINV
jgi:glutathione S-transferase